ncbi:MAG TPA: DUF3142 domain-containing protein [Terriglobia bacterium]|nr:DUF3142 domain-containing protein [Terriglobia bacterium]
MPVGGALLLAALASVFGSGLPLAGLNFASSSSPSSGHPASSRLALLPPVIVWAWERPEDLRFLPARGVGVSFLAETVTLSGGEVRVRPRLQALQVTPGTPLEACARIEVDPRKPPALSAAQTAAASAALASLGNLAGISAVQVDFDATTSERAFYAGLLRDLRRRLPPSMPLSITALTSWCAGDPWIAGLPVDEAVPMLFRMGPDAADVRLRLAEGRDFTPAVCRGSLGISTDERIRDLPSGRRLYVFRPNGWSRDAFKAVLAEEKR